MKEAKTPEVYDQLYLPKLEEEYKQSLEWLRSNSFSTRKYMHIGTI